LIAAAACGGASPSDESAAQSTEDVTTLPGLSGYYQIDSAQPAQGEITLLSLAPAMTFWAERCADDACDPPEQVSGTYKRTKTKLRLYDANKALIASYSYSIQGDSLYLRATGTSDLYELDTMSESLCDDSGGAWSDDDLATHGFNCSCPADADWGPGGCASCAYGQCTPTCAAPQTVCGNQCVDLSSDNTNCGACGNTCTKAQHCVSGGCQ
jgi:hypothetical protein